jgi:uncharacterized membrane protein YfhO
MSNNNEDTASGLGGALLETVKRLKDPFLLGMLGCIIVLGFVAVARTDIYVTIVLAIVVVVLFLSYLIFLWRTSVSRIEQMTRELANQMIIAIQRDEYIKGPQRKLDFGASLVRAIRKSEIDKDYKKAVEAMAKKFKDGFNVPDSIL